VRPIDQEPEVGLIYVFGNRIELAIRYYILNARRDEVDDWRLDLMSPSGAIYRSHRLSGDCAPYHNVRFDDPTDDDLVMLARITLVRED
jgi:hypothetical protein